VIGAGVLMYNPSTWPATALATIKAISMPAVSTTVSGIGTRIVFIAMTLLFRRQPPVQALPVLTLGS
jgi:hypothetical protein